MRNCAHCNKTLHVDDARVKYHPDCAIETKRARVAASVRKHREKHGTPKQKYNPERTEYMREYMRKYRSSED